jgi:hypothetical protein
MVSILAPKLCQAQCLDSNLDHKMHLATADQIQNLLKASSMWDIRKDKDSTLTIDFQLS